MAGMRKTVRSTTRPRDRRVGSHDAEEGSLTSRSLRERLFRLALCFLWNREDAEDVVQDSLLAAHTHEARARGGRQRWAWLCQIVVRRCYDSGRRKRRRERRDKALVEQAVACANASDDVAPEPRLALVRSLMEKLPRRQREVMVLRHLQGMSFDQIGAVLEMSPATARVHAMAGREALRDRLVETAPEMFDRALSGESEQERSDDGV